MLTMHPTLLIGPSDWQPDRMPQAEFARRIEALFRRDPEAERAIVYGNSHRHAELAYFTNLTPKLEATAALLTRNGEHRLFVGGGPNMLDAARPLTWVKELAPLRELIEVVRPGGSIRKSLIVGADTMPVGFRRSLMEAAGNKDAVQDATEHVWMQMRRKSAFELAAIRDAAAAMRRASAVMLAALKSGAGVTEVISAGELAANAEGAQDVRTLFSLDGGRTLQPFVRRRGERVDPLLIYLAVRRYNYWAECFPLLAARAPPDPLVEKVQAAMAAVVQAIRAGTSAQEIRALIAAAIAPHQPHPLTAHSFAQRMGIALDQPPYTDIGATFEDGEVYALRVGASDGETGYAVCSQMISVRQEGNEALSSSEPV
jgi:Xaa-Pro aminopeptidase